MAHCRVSVRLDLLLREKRSKTQKCSNFRSWAFYAANEAGKLILHTYIHIHRQTYIPTDTLTFSRAIQAHHTHPNTSAKRLLAVCICKSATSTPFLCRRSEDARTTRRCIQGIYDLTVSGALRRGFRRESPYVRGSF